MPAEVVNEVLRGCVRGTAATSNWCASQLWISLPWRFGGPARWPWARRVRPPSIPRTGPTCVWPSVRRAQSSRAMIGVAAIPCDRSRLC